METRVIKRLEGCRLTVGGEAHRGWLPLGAAEPTPAPVREVTFDLQIAFDGTNWFLEFDSDDPEFRSGDTWHQSLEEAERQAQIDFGVEPSQWKSTS